VKSRAKIKKKQNELNSRNEGTNMTIEELHIWAKENGYENYDIEVMQNDGSYYSANFSEILIEDNSILL